MLSKEQQRANNRLKANFDAMRYNLERDYLRQKYFNDQRAQLNNFVYDLLINVNMLYSDVISELEIIDR